MVKEALILVGHGSRLPYSRELIKGFAEEIEKRNEYPIVTFGMMEFNTPTIKDAVKSAVDQGAKKIIVVPVFLAKGIHTERDIPTILRLKPTDEAKEASEKNTIAHAHNHGQQGQCCNTEKEHCHQHEHHGHGHAHTHGHAHHHHDHKSDMIDELPDDVEIVYRDIIGVDSKLVDIIIERSKGQ